ncbi:hypothetical protein [Crateriforma conspicua]|uniref:Uncharacterized protein n=1 Tax=Crateriforma conspicua TaxID=2527996 RepID=A0A5C5Y8W5_9PLAN|nr:hypothetical protein [Crateriforma conspicua]TWT71780.1 hypothetical protein Pan14r_40960 [Crateriforma conspicua]
MHHLQSLHIPRRRIPATSLLTLPIVVAFAGCGPTDTSSGDATTQNPGHDDHDRDHDGHDHGSHDHPESLGEAVEHIQEMGGTIVTAFESGDPEDAHHELHEIGHVIESLPGLAKKANLTSEQQDAINNATEALIDAFGELDGTLHGGDDVETGAISKQISDQIEKLKTMPAS